MAVKFTLPDGSTTDVSTQTARLFVSSTPDGFVDLLKAMRPGLTTPLRMARYFLTHPRLLGALPGSCATPTGSRQATAPSNTTACTPSRWIAADGTTRFVRYHLVPAAGAQYLSGSAAQGEGPDFLTDELNTRLASGPVRFDYRVQIAGPSDSTVDPSAPWQSTRSPPSAPSRSPAWRPSASTATTSSCSTRCG